MFDNPTPMEHKDIPKGHIDEDELGFEPFVKKVATGIKGYSQKECFIISVEGQWGIGKTTFMNMVKNELKRDVEFLHFNPWLLTDIESLVVTFFSELMKVINRIDFDAKLKEEILQDMKKFLVGLSYILPESVSLGISGTKVKYNIRGTIDKVSAEKKLTLDEQKEKINEYLFNIYKKTGKKILIVIDDIDRLMDKETELIFRLIKGIADFNNIIYVLLFDREIVTKSLIHFKSEDGSKYLDKVIQYPLVVPKPFSDNVREMLRVRLDEYLTSLSKSYNYPFNQNTWNALYLVLPKYIKTVRDVHKIFATVSFEFESICEDINFVDFLIITIIRLQAHNLYQFIKEKPEYFSQRGAYEVLDYDQIREGDTGKNLATLIRKQVKEFDDYFELLQIIFPIFDKYNPHDINNDHENKPIADRFYFDSYFSMTVSADKLSHQQYINLFNKLINEAPNFATEMANLDDSRRVQFVSILKSKTLDNNTVLTISREVLRMINTLIQRDFRNDESFCDNASYESLWINLIATMISNQDHPREAFALFEDPHIEVQYKCYLNQLLQKKFKDKAIAEHEEYLEKLQEKNIKTLENMDFEEFISHEFLDILSLCFYWNNIEAEALKIVFTKELLRSKDSFFAIFEKYVHKQVSMPRKELPYSINKSALKVMIDLERVDLYITEIKKFALSQEESTLLQYWDNSRNYE